MKYQLLSSWTKILVGELKRTSQFKSFVFKIIHLEMFYSAIIVKKIDIHYLTSFFPLRKERLLGV